MLQGFLKTHMGTLGKTYRSVLAGKLKAHSLKYEDLLIESPDVVKALSRTDATVLLERERRIKRAFDVSAKKKAIPAEYHGYNPYEFQLEEKIEKAELERTERQLLDA